MIKYLVMDVDGTLTDGKIYMGQDGELLKAFDVKDGCGIKEILPEHSVTPIIITARNSRILENRCKELGIEEVYQGFRNKQEILLKILEKKGDDLRTVAYIGDDVPDIDCMLAVKNAGGKVLCPADAVYGVKNIADYISGKKAGEGAVRDCIEYLVSKKPDDSLENKIKGIIENCLQGQFKDKAAGEYRFDDGTEYSVIECLTEEEEYQPIITPENCVIIQFVLEGREMIKLYRGVEMESSRMILGPQGMLVIQANQPYREGILLGEKREKVRKIVCRITK